MALPNIVSPTTINLKNIASTVGTSATTLVTCGSNKSVKVSALMAANVTQTASSVSLRISDGTATHSLLYSVTVPVSATLLMVTRDAPAYLKEGESLQAVAGATGAINVVGSYEEIA